MSVASIFWWIWEGRERGLCSGVEGGGGREERLVQFYLLMLILLNIYFATKIMLMFMKIRLIKNATSNAISWTVLTTGEKVSRDYRFNHHDIDSDSNYKGFVQKSMLSWRPTYPQTLLPNHHWNPYQKLSLSIFAQNIFDYTIFHALSIEFKKKKLVSFLSAI